MKLLISLLSFTLALCLPLRAQHHVFPPLTPGDLAKIQAATSMVHADAQPAQPRRLLVFYLTEGFVHDSIPYGTEALKELGEKTGAYTADISDDMAVFTPDNLKKYDAVIFVSTTNLKFTDPAQRAALFDFIKSGKGFAGIHAATDNFNTWPEAQAMIGGTFADHPWGAGDTVGVKIDDPASPLVKAFGSKGFWVNDEIYKIGQPFDRAKQHVLMSIDMSKKEDQRDPKRMGTVLDFPISWIKPFGDGRVFYCSIGHNQNVFWCPEILKFYLNGIQYALGDLKADSTPSAQVTPAPQPELAPEHPAAINSNDAPKPAAGAPAAYSPPAALLKHLAFVSLLVADVPGPPDAAAVARDKINPPPTTPPITVDDGVKAIAVYDNGKDTTQIVAFQEQIKRSSPEDKAKIEPALIPLLSQADVPLGGKELVCRWLGFMGTDASVPALKAVLTDPKLSHLAAYALMEIGTPAAQSALLGSLGSVPADQRPAIINVLGRQHVVAAVPSLVPLVTSSDKAQARAAIDALGAIATPAALQALGQLKVDPTLETALQWSVVNGAFRLMSTTPAGIGTAASIFEWALKTAKLSSIRVAAAQGTIQADPANAWTNIAPLLKETDSPVAMDTARFVGRLPENTIPAIVTLLPSLDPTIQCVIVNHLADKKSAAIEPVLQAAVASSSPTVVVAGVRGYGTANLPNSATVLLPLLAKGGEEGNAAVASLEKLSDPAAATAIKAALSADGSDKPKLMGILAARADRSALDTFLTAAASSDQGTAEAGFDGVSVVADNNSLDRILPLVASMKTDRERTSMQSILIRSARGAKDKDAVVGLLVNAIQGASPDNRKPLLLGLVFVGTPKAMAAVQTLLQAPSIDDRKNVIRALSSLRSVSSGPDPTMASADKILLGAASAATDPSEKTLALRGYLDNVRQQNFRDEERVDAYKAAWPAAAKPEDKQAILDALKNINNDQAKKAIQDLSASSAKPA